MNKRYSVFTLLLLLPSVAAAHTLNVSYIDIQQTAEELIMTTALHPHQALIVAGLTHDEHDPHEGGFAHLIPALRAQSDVLAAYAAAHITVTANDEQCTWDPQRITIPNEELTALAEGITIAGIVTCRTQPVTALTIGTSLFFDAFPTSRIAVRQEYPDGFAEQFVLTTDQREGVLVLEKTQPVPPAVQEKGTDQAHPAATRMGWIVVVSVLGGAGFAAYRTNSASPKE